jgi:hypothetical protein
MTSKYAKNIEAYFLHFLRQLNICAFYFNYNFFGSVAQWHKKELVSGLA